jgi:hypothetical protein
VDRGRLEALMSLGLLEEFRFDWELAGADSLTVRALSGEDGWGPSDHCRVLVEMDET